MKSNIVNIPFNGKDQFWYIHLDESCCYPSINEYMTPTSLDSFRFFKLLKSIQNIGNYENIYAEPLISEDANVNSTLSYRGCKEDTDPFVLRKRNIPPFRASVSFSSSTEKKYINFTSSAYGEPLTPGQLTFLHQNFDEGIKAICNPETIEFLKKKMLKDVVVRIRRKLTDLETNIEVFNSQIDEYVKNNKVFSE